MDGGRRIKGNGTDKWNKQPTNRTGMRKRRRWSLELEDEGREKRRRALKGKLEGGRKSKERNK